MQSVKSDLQSIFHQYDDIQELFFQGDVSSFDINARDSHGKSLFHHACEYGLTEGVLILLDNDAQVDVCDEKGYTPLHYACQNIHIHYDICKIVIQSDPYYLTLSSTQGGNGSRSTVTSQDECNRAILHYACIHGDLDTVDNLLKAGADSCAQDKLGNSPMHYACENGHLQCVRQLIATSQNPNGLLRIPNNDGVTPSSMKTQSGGTILHVACENPDAYVAAKLLEAGADTNILDVFGFTPMSVITGSGGTILHAACDKADINLIKKLLEAGVDPNVTDKFGFTPLMKAVVNASKFGITTDVVSSIITTLCNSKCRVNAKLLPSKPFDSNVHYCEGSTALHIAIDGWTDNQLCVQALLDNGAALDVRDVHGRIPLHIAGMRGHHRLIKLLAPSPESFYFKDNDGCTPLFYACKNSQLEYIKRFLIQTPCVISDSMKVTNNDGTTPLSVRTGSGGTILHVACDKGDINVVKKLLKAGADSNVTDEMGFTPLMRAVVSTSKSSITTDVGHSIITVLCRSQCSVNTAFIPSKTSDPNLLYYKGSTALHMAIDNWMYSQLCVRALVNNGAALDTKDVHGRTPLHIASIRGHHRLIKLLAPSPESFYFKDNDGCTPLHYVCKNSHLECVREFLVQAPDVISDLIKIAYNDGTTPLSVRTGSGRTILHVACDKGDSNLVKMLLEAGADPNITDKFGFTLLMRTVVSTSKFGITTDVVHSVFTALCNGKCNINAPFVASKLFNLNVSYHKGSTALHMAIDNWIYSQLCVQALVDNGAALDARDVHGRTPIHIASIRGHYGLINLVAPTPEFFHFKDNDGCTPLYYVCKNSHLEFIRNFIVQNPGVIGDLMKVANNDGTTPLSVRTESDGTILHVACEKREIDLLQKLLKAGADPNVTDEFGFTPLMRVVVSTINSDVDYSIITTLRLCKSRGSVNTPFVPSKPSDSNIHYYEGSTALHMAIDGWTVNQLCVQALVNNGAALDANDVHGRTPLHIASMWGHHRLIKLLAPSPESLHFRDNVGCTSLYYACENSRIECIREFLQLVQAPDVISDLMKIANNDGTTPLSVRTGSGRTILHVACEKGDVNLVKKLLEAGADPNVTDKYGFTPLMKAVVNASKSGITPDAVSSIITALCNSKCCVNAPLVPSKPAYSNVQYCGFSTALHMAIDEWTVDQSYVQALVNNGAALDARDVHGRTPLHIASMRGHHRLIKLLAPSSETFHFKDNDGCTPLYYACKNSHVKCIRKFMVQIPDVINDLMKVANNDGTTPLSVRTGSGGTILHVACDKGDFSAVKKVLEAGADPIVTDRFGCTPLHYACKNSHLECVREVMVQIPGGICDLLKVANECGVTPLSVRGDNDQTILHIACIEGDLPIVQKVLEAGADPNSCYGSTFTPLMLAVKHVDDVKAADIIAVLCEFKCNVNIQTSRPSRAVTALHLACELGKEKCVEMLIAKGANVFVQTQSGLTPLHLACEGGYHTFISSLITEETLKAHDDNFKYWTPLHYACRYHHIECVRRIVVGFSKLLQTHTEYNLPFHSLRDQDGRTILHHACLRNDVQFVENLLNLGADPNVQDNNGVTPLMSALLYHGSNVDMNLLSLLLSLDWKPDIKDNNGRTALHYSAFICDDTQIPLMLISAGCDITAFDNYGQTFSDLLSKESLQLINKQLLKIDRRQIICVVGYPKCGKTTIIAAFQRAQQNRGTFQRFTARLKFNARVTLDDSRTAGIDTKVITTKRLGSLIFFDFAGQSEYYSSHLAFLESVLSAKESTITFIMMVDLRCSEEDRIAQCKEWLFPIKSILEDHNMLNVILIGSHLDQVGSVSTSALSLQDTLKELKRTLGTPQMQFIDCWGMDCRQLSSKGMTNLQNSLQSTHPAHSTSAEASQVPLGACLLFDRLKKSENPSLAITPSKIIDNLKDGRPPFPLTVKYIDSCCQDLAASGLVLYIPNREDAGESWLILEMEEILSCIHGKLFAPDSAEFPMHHKNLANQFGLVHMEELSFAFKDSPLNSEMVQKLLTAMEFCHPVDSSLMTEGILDVLFFRVSHDLREKLLFFPSLVKANEEPVVLSTSSDIPGDDCHWVCWELSTVKPHFLHPRFQQAVFIRLACNHVQKLKSDLSTIEEHSCTVSKNAMSWSTIHGVDVCVQIMHKSTIKVLARSRPGVKVFPLMEMFSSVVSDVLTVRTNHAPGVDAYSVFRVMEKGTPGEHTVTVSSIIDVVQAGGMYVNSRERPPKLVSLKDLFLDWEISVTLLEKMVSISKINCDVQITTEDVSEDTHSGPVMIDEHYYESELHFSFIYLGFIPLFNLLCQNFID